MYYQVFGYGELDICVRRPLPLSIPRSACGNVGSQVPFVDVAQQVVKVPLLALPQASLPFVLSDQRAISVKCHDVLGWHIGLNVGSRGQHPPSTFPQSLEQMSNVIANVVR